MRQPAPLWCAPAMTTCKLWWMPRPPSAAKVRLQLAHASAVVLSAPACRDAGTCSVALLSTERRRLKHACNATCAIQSRLPGLPAFPSTSFPTYCCRADLVFIQNGMLQPWLDERGLGEATQVRPA